MSEKEAIRQKIVQVLKKNGFSRPDPGPAHPGTYDGGSSYKSVVGREIGGVYYETKSRLFHLGCLAGPYYDGTSDHIYIDVISGEPWYIVSSQNGGIWDFSIYDGKPVTFDMVRDLAKASGETVFIDISEKNWISKLPETALKKRMDLLNQVEKDSTK